jgi:hypothetical protein
MIVKFWNDGWTPNGDITVPEDFVFMKSGIASLTRDVVAAMKKLKLNVYAKMIKDRSFSRQVGIFALPHIIEAAIKKNESRNTPEHLEKLEKARKRKQQREIKDFAENIKERFPSCPEDVAEQIARHTCATGSGNVGRSTTADDPVWCAVVAHVRHCHTSYEKLLRSGWDRQDARDYVQTEIDMTIDDWEQEPSSSP